MPVPSDKRTAAVVPSNRPPADAKPLLVVIAGADLGLQIDLASGVVDIGRDEGATLRIDSELVSRQHAAIRRFGGKFAIADLGSTNGTFVNDRRIQTHTLSDGDLIRVGKVVLKYTECAIEAQYHEQIALRANLDALTGVYNKRHFDDVLKKLFASSKETGKALSLVVFDIDHFKRINDTWGHAAGDAVLRQVSDLVRTLVRKHDAFCRVGGEEFTVLFEGVPLADARKAAELVRRSIESADIASGDTKIPVTASIGVVELLPEDTSADSLFQRADAKLYEAKRSGRNRVR